MSNTFRLIAKYNADAETGQTYSINEYQEFIEVETKEGREFIPGMKELRLDDGSRVNYIDENTFKIVQSGTILKRVI
jgi:hypothetical protein